MIDMTINNHCVEVVADSGAQVSVLSRIFYDSLSCRPRPVESIRLKGASASGVMVGCRVDGLDVDLGDDHGNYSMTMYVADITDNCILGLDYLKAQVRRPFDNTASSCPGSLPLSIIYFNVVLEQLMIVVVQNITTLFITRVHLLSLRPPLESFLSPPSKQVF